MILAVVLVEVLIVLAVGFLVVLMWVGILKPRRARRLVTTSLAWQNAPAVVQVDSNGNSSQTFTLNLDVSIAGGGTLPPQPPHLVLLALDPADPPDNSMYSLSMTSANLTAPGRATVIFTSRNFEGELVLTASDTTKPLVEIHRSWCDSALERLRCGSDLRQHPWAAQDPVAKKSASLRWPPNRRSGMHPPPGSQQTSRSANTHSQHDRRALAGTKPPVMLLTRLPTRTTSPCLILSATPCLRSSVKSRRNGEKRFQPDDRCAYCCTEDAESFEKALT